MCGNHWGQKQTQGLQGPDGKEVGPKPLRIPRSGMGGDRKGRTLQLPSVIRGNDLRCADHNFEIR